jgi:hypothetical protein
LANEFKKNETYDGEHGDRAENYQGAKDLIGKDSFPDGSTILWHYGELFSGHDSVGRGWLFRHF